jgi:hypothetical protein
VEISQLKLPVASCGRWLSPLPATTYSADGSESALERTTIMLRSKTDIENFTISATDGPIGLVKDLYFDDDAWAIRYLVVDTGSWLMSRKVLISPISLQQPNWEGGMLPASLTKEQVKNSPDFDTAKPVSRKNEEKYMEYYGYPFYWGGAGMWGWGLYPYAMAPGAAGYQVEHEPEGMPHTRAERAAHCNNGDPHLRSCNEGTGYHISATNGEIGHIAGYLIDDETWAIRYLIVDTSNWWLGHKVLIAPEWISGMHWPSETVSVNLTRESVKNAPVYDPAVAWSREFELRLYEHYGRPGYWEHGVEDVT